ncbi:MAG: hypothetical protein K6G44_18605 [Lentisphaeria bacterium]|nr:hypothetical protein [Lentisphaeria bacterium]
MSWPWFVSFLFCCFLYDGGCKIKAPSRRYKKGGLNTFQFNPPRPMFCCCGRQQSAIQRRHAQKGRDGASPGPIEADCVAKLMLHEKTIVMNNLIKINIIVMPAAILSNEKDKKIPAKFIAGIDDQL